MPINRAMTVCLMVKTPASSNAPAAATKGALTMIVEKKAPSSVQITLLTGDTLDIAIHTCVLDRQDEATCTVIKDAGDDPDVTHKAEIGATVELMNVDSGASENTNGSN